MKTQQKQLERLAHYDPLTGLPNRLLLADRLRHALAYARRHDRPLAVVYLDLDGFKAINDRHGHQVGDDLLVVVSQRLQSSLREEDTLARLGGDEFMAVLVGLEQPQDYQPIATRLLQLAAAPVELGAHTLSVSASVGVTLYPEDNVDADELICHADQAMYQAKMAGKNRYCHFQPP